MRCVLALRKLLKCCRMANNNVDVRIKLAIESKEYQKALREANREAKEFKRQQRDAIKNAGVDQGFSAIVAAAKKVAPAVSAGAAAMAVANKALQENQRFTDEWARITESAKATYESFVDSLANADFSNFFSNMDSIIQSARDAADAIDNLDTTKIFSDLALAEINLEASKYRYTLRSKTASAGEKEIARQGLIATRDRQMKVALDTSDANMQAFAATLADYVTRKGYSASAADFLTTGADGRLAASGLFDKYYGSLSTYQAWDAKYKAFAASAVRKDYRGNEYRAVSGMGTMSEADFQELRAFLELSDDKLKETFGYYKQGLSDLKSVYDAMASDSRYITSTVSSGTAGVKAVNIAPEGSIAAKQAQIAEAKKAWQEARTDIERISAQEYVKVLEEQLERMENPLYGAVGAGKSLDITRTPLTGLKGVGTSNIASETEDLKDNAKASEIAANSIVTLTDTIGQLGLLSGVVAPEVQQFTRTLGSVLQMIGSAIGGPWGVAIQGIGSLVGSFSNGGIVGGSSFTGDHLIARVNSREMILNDEQQKNLFALANGAGVGGNISYSIRGEDLWLILNNHKRRTGKA